MKKVLITGEAGHLGRLLYGAFKNDDYQMINDKVDKTDIEILFNKKNLPCTFDYNYEHELNINQTYGLYKIIDEHKPDIIIHTAAYVGTDKCESDDLEAFRTNVSSIRDLATIIRNTIPDCLVVNFSTTATMNPLEYNLERPITTKTNRNPITWYGQTKLMSEMIVKQFAKNWINFLPVFLFGDYPFDTSSIWARMFIDNLKEKKYKIKLNKDIYKEYEYSKNVIPIIKKIIENHRSIGNDIIIAGPDMRPFGEFLKSSNQIFFSKFKKELNYELFPDEDYLGNHIADYHDMLKYANVSDSEFTNSRFSFENAIEKVIDSIGRTI